MNEVEFKRPRVDKTTGNIIDDFSAKSIYFQKKSVPYEQYRADAISRVDDYLKRIYGPLELSLDALKKNGNVRSVAEICRIIEQSIESGSPGSPNKYLPTCAANMTIGNGSDLGVVQSPASAAAR